MDAEQLQTAAARADMAAATLRSGTAQAKAGLLDTLVRQVRLHEDRIEVRLELVCVREHLGFADGSELPHELPAITIEAVRVRRCHQLRLIVPGPESSRPKPSRRDDKLIALVADAYQARQLVLANPGQSIASIARANGRCRTRLGKLVALSCLAPDIVTAIIEGKQPEHLSANRLTNIDLPLFWADQRRELGFARISDCSQNFRTRDSGRIVRESCVTESSL